MAKDNTYTHPTPTLNRLAHYVALVLALVIVGSVPFQVILAFLIVPGGLFFITAVFTLLLIFPLLLLLSATPPVVVSGDGLTIHPVVWRERYIKWEAVQAVKIYPLLPPPDAETGRRALVGRRKYRPAEGIMLIVTGLPIQYRVTGFFVGEGWQSVIAVTSRTHTNYPTLVKFIIRHVDNAIVEEDVHAPRKL